MSRFEFVSCRLAVQICVGHFPDGRERHRTLSLKNIKPDADAAALITVVRAIGSLLAYPVTHVRLIIKSRRVLFDVKSGMTAGEGEICAPNPAPETRGENTVFRAPFSAPKTPGDTPAGDGALGVPFYAGALTKKAAGACLFFEIFKNLKNFPAVFRMSCQKYQQQTTGE
ncbi:MAG: hypothetical protein LBE65_00995 [Synergistaceae bacterium]|nr:hypothetical protein [Synergistaceae bacterium]